MRAIKRKLLQSLMTARAKQLRQTYPQLACFSHDVIGMYIHVDGRYELELLSALADKVFSQLPARKVCLDIGANIGNHSAFFSEYFEQVFAFEPMPRTYQLLTCNAMLFDNVKTYNFGLSEQASVQTAHFNSMNIGGASLHVKDGANMQSADMELKALDEIADIQSLDQIDFIKIDVERHELNCLEGARNTLEKYSPVVGIEVLGDEVKMGSSQALDKLSEFGYKYQYDFQTNRPLAWAPKPIAKLTMVLLGLFANYRPSHNFTIAPLALASHKDYPLILCSKTPLKEG